MTKTLTHSSLLIVSLLIIGALFVTSQNYSQLAIAVVLYSGLIFIGFKLFPHSIRIQKKAAQTPPELPQKQMEEASLKREPAYIADMDKRTFIKLIGATGISFFVFSLLGRRAESLIFGSPGDSRGAPQPNNSGNQAVAADLSPTAGYRISEIAEGDISYYGFIDTKGGWLVMRQDINESTFRYAKGTSSFPESWSNREKLQYDYYYNLH